MVRIGLCGGSGSGKTRLSALFSSHGIPTLDTDALYHDMLSRPCGMTRDLAAVFGDGILSSDGGVDRDRLRALVFESGCSDRITRLNHTVHPHVCRACKRWADSREKSGVWAICYDAPLLFESGLDRDCTVTVGVIAPLETRLRRIIQRDGVSEEAALRRLAAQLPDDELKRRCDYIIDNDGTVEELCRRGTDLIQIIKIGAAT